MRVLIIDDNERTGETLAAVVHDRCPQALVTRLAADGAVTIGGLLQIPKSEVELDFLMRFRVKADGGALSAEGMEITQIEPAN